MELSDIKRKVTAILAINATLENQYREAVAYNAQLVRGTPKKSKLPHLVDITWLTSSRVVLITTIEPRTLLADVAIQGWDGIRGRIVTFKWGEILDAALNSISYEPANNEEWERREWETNYNTLEELQPASNKAVFINYRYARD